MRNKKMGLVWAHWDIEIEHFGLLFIESLETTYTTYASISWSHAVIAASIIQVRYYRSAHVVY